MLSTESFLRMLDHLEREIIVTLSAIESKLLHDKSILFSPNWFLSIGPYISSEKFIKILGRGKSKVCLS